MCATAAEISRSVCSATLCNGKSRATESRWCRAVLAQRLSFAKVGSEAKHPAQGRVFDQAHSNPDLLGNEFFTREGSKSAKAAQQQPHRRGELVDRPKADLT
jgi:hypothetical protein